MIHQQEPYNEAIFVSKHNSNYNSVTMLSTSSHATEASSCCNSSSSSSAEVWKQCQTRFRRSHGDLIRNHHVDPMVQQHMELPPVLATLEAEEIPMSVHYFTTRRDAEYDSDSEVECVALPTSHVEFPLTALRRQQSTCGSDINPEYHYHRLFASAAAASSKA